MSEDQRPPNAAEHVLIAQISDLHLTPPGVLYNDERNGWPKLSAAIDELNALSPRPDALVVSGDLADRPDIDVYVRLREALRGLNMPAYVFPGNHDDRELFRSAFADSGYVPESAPFIQFVIETMPLRLVILDSMDPPTGAARLCAARLDWLRDRLDEDPTRPTMLFMHHQPLYTRLGFGDAGEAFPGVDGLRTLLGDYPNVTSIACGHLHRPIQMRLGNVPVSVAPSITYQRTLTLDNAMPKAFVNEPVSMLLHLWHPKTGVVTHTHFVGDFGAPSPMLD